MVPLTLQAHATADGPLIAAGGALDYETAQDFHDLLRTVVLLPGQHLSVNLEGVEFFDSSGVRALLAARNLAISAEAGLVLIATPGHVVRVLDALGLQEPFGTGSPPPRAS
ncbi:STAS domain-containing protein [Streptomyces sp. H39-S7]|uniref:STAS domain-containing protein n=1 Tax=Streptomyces sp. H39-S7 TaxID=3004357 RepID=UPI0022B00085|nr:STAS domain-containing protein [Streptomyces sp. H39-S7]MCZ4119795.1 STAS domain-containing protein [Streptomyces sp. H39-S7]